MPLTCPNTDLTMGWRLESYSDAALRRLAVRLSAGCAGVSAAGSELRLDDDPVMTLSADSKKKAASSGCLEYDGVGEVLLSGLEPLWTGGSW